MGVFDAVGVQIEHKQEMSLKKTTSPISNQQTLVDLDGKIIAFTEIFI